MIKREHSYYVGGRVGLQVAVVRFGLCTTGIKNGFASLVDVLVFSLTFATTVFIKSCKREYI